MNWTVFLAVIGSFALLCASIEAISYSEWEYPSFHQSQLHRIWVMFGVGVICIAIVAGLAGRS